MRGDLEKLALAMGDLCWISIIARTRRDWTEHAALRLPKALLVVGSVQGSPARVAVTRLYEATMWTVRHYLEATSCSAFQFRAPGSLLKSRNTAP